MTLRKLEGGVRPSTAFAPRPPSRLLMPSTPSSSSSNFQSIFDVALSDYAKQTSIDLPTHPFAQSLQNCDSPERILDLLGEKAKQFQAYRDGNRKLINCLKPVVQILHTVSSILGEASSMVRPTETVPSYLIVSLWSDI